jgi:hypothetical protein
MSPAVDSATAYPWKVRRDVTKFFPLPRRARAGSEKKAGGASGPGAAAAIAGTAAGTERKMKGNKEGRIA